ncbi:MAG: hypothetical protein U9P00_14465 [Pseudomonadota bacterium]|nr:hypothetical protein [Pseudomonadota bacterium]
MHTIFHMGHYEWAEIGFFWILTLIVAVLLVLQLQRPRSNKLRSPSTETASTLWHSLPEIRLITVALPLELLWEIAQFPLYTVWHQNDWSYILYGLAHCTLGDLLILLVIYELISAVQRDRHWYRHSALSGGVLFTVAGLGYTIYSEITHVRIKGTWGYTELMPIVPLIEIGGMPFLQWLLMPPVLLWLMRQLPPAPATRDYA